MNIKNLKLVGIALLVGSVASAAASREISYDITNCYQGTVTLVSGSKELVILGYELTGITQSNTEDKATHGSAMHCVGTNKIVNGQHNSHGYCKYTRPNGDVIIGEFQSQPDGHSKWTALAGTGEFQGVTGGGTSKTFLRGKAAKPGMISGCGRAEGTYTVPD